MTNVEELLELIKYLDLNGRVFVYKDDPENTMMYDHYELRYTKIGLWYCAIEVYCDKISTSPSLGFPPDWLIDAALVELREDAAKKRAKETP